MKKLKLPGSKTQDEILNNIVNKMRSITLHLPITKDREISLWFVIKYYNEIGKIIEEVYKENKPKYNYDFWSEVAKLNPVEGVVWCINDGGDYGEKYGSVVIEVDDWSSMNFSYNEFDAIEEMWNVIQSLPKLSSRKK